MVGWASGGCNPVLGWAPRGSCRATVCRPTGDLCPGWELPSCKAEGLLLAAQDLHAAARCCRNGFAGLPATPVWVSVAEARGLCCLPLLCIDLLLCPALLADASGNPVLKDIGVFMRDQLKARFQVAASLSRILVMQCAAECGHAQPCINNAAVNNAAVVKLTTPISSTPTDC